MDNPDSIPHRFFASLALLCLPLAFQLAAAAPDGLPEALWSMLVISVWASLVVALALAAALVWGVARALRRARARRLDFRGLVG